MMMQCKDVPTEPILRLLATTQDRWAFWSDLDSAVSPDVPWAVRVAKMRKLAKKRLISGCVHDGRIQCRGDFEITDKGLARIGLPPRTRPRIG